MFLWSDSHLFGTIVVARPLASIATAIGRTVHQLVRQNLKSSFNFAQMLGLWWTHVHETFGFIPGSLGIWYPSPCWPFNKRNFKLNSCLQCGNKCGKSWCQSEPILGARSPVSDAIRLPGARHVLLRPRPGFFPLKLCSRVMLLTSCCCPRTSGSLENLAGFCSKAGEPGSGAW